jgi:ABC-type microcin C transport system duplicated ATPase subunit YejF
MLGSEQQYFNNSVNISSGYLHGSHREALIISRINQFDSSPFPTQEISQTEQSQTDLFVQLLQNIPKKNVKQKELTSLQKTLKELQELQELAKIFGFNLSGKEVKRIMIEVFLVRFPNGTTLLNDKMSSAKKIKNQLLLI